MYLSAFLRVRGMGSFGRQLEDLWEELGGPHAGLDLRGLDVVVAEDRRWVYLKYNDTIDRDILDEIAARHVGRHCRSRRDNELGERSPVCDTTDIT